MAWTPNHGRSAVIRVTRNSGVPPSLSATPTERDQITKKVIDALSEHGSDLQLVTPHEFRMVLSGIEVKHARYRNPEVKDALRETFQGKCAYCEAYAISVSPEDVEHYRPKGRVASEGGGVLTSGYYWLGDEWTNLLLSCIDCNRRREHPDRDGKPVLLGKADLFPILDEDERCWHHEQGLERESPLLLDPCTDEPSNHLLFSFDGLVLGETLRGETSIRVYGLNRPGLVWARRERAVLLDLHLRLVEQLARLHDDLETRGDPLHVVAGDAVALLVDFLRSGTGAHKEFAGMLRQLTPGALLER